ncbi:hypothetical protein ACTXPA_07240 [Glutamicibacter arilaitensis]|uniref:hypothetical protein n=1 Tax=Glutamicibacter arilaitensis TaxID=256701 RepID=UPI003FD2FD88
MSANEIVKSIDPFLAPQVLESVGQFLDDGNDLTAEVLATIVANVSHGFNTDSTEPRVKVLAGDFTE